MKQIILLISLISSIFTFNSREDSNSLQDRISGGWTLIGGSSKVAYFDVENNLIEERLLPLNVSGTILNVGENNLLIRNNKNALSLVDYTLSEINNAEGNLDVKVCPSIDDTEIISLINNKNLELSRDNNKTLFLSADFDKSGTSKLLDNTIAYNHAKVLMVFKKNSFFSDILPY